MGFDPATARFYPPEDHYLYADEAGRRATYAQLFPPLPPGWEPPPPNDNRRNPYSYAPDTWEGD